MEDSTTREPTTPSGADIRSTGRVIPPMVTLSGLELRSVSAQRTVGADLARHLGAFERLVRLVVLGLGGVVALDQLADADGLTVQLLVGCPDDGRSNPPWSPAQQLERFRLSTAQAFSFQRLNTTAHLDRMRPLDEVMVFEPSIVRVSHGGASATVALPLEFSLAGKGTIAQILDLGSECMCCVRTVVAPALCPSPKPESLMAELADADALIRDPEVPHAVAYRARGVRRALESTLDCWLGRHCAVEIQVRAENLASASRLIPLMREELSLAKDELDRNGAPRPGLIRMEAADSELPKLALQPSERMLPPAEVVMAPVPSFWATGRGERPKHLAGLEAATTLVLPPLPAYCDLRSIQRVVVEDRVAPRPTAWLGAPQVGVDSSANPIALDDEVLARHVHVMGVPGSGKTTVMRRMVLGDLEHDRGFVVLDPHSDLSRRVVSSAGFEPGLGITGDVAFPGLHVLCEGAEGQAEIDRDIGVIIEAIEATLPALYSGPRFRQYARDLLTLHAYVGAGQPLECVVDYLEDDDVLQQALRVFDGPQAVQRRLTEHSQIGDSDRVELTQWITCKFGDYFRTEAARALFAPVGQGTTATELAKSKAKLVIDFNGMGCSVHDAGFLGQLFIATLLRDLVKGGPDLSRRFVLYLDEVQLFFGPSVERALQEGRKYGLSVVAAHQTSTQLEPQRFDALVGQVGLEMLFRSTLRDAALHAERLNIDIDSLTAVPDFQCWVTGTVAQQRGGPFLMTTSL